MATDAYSAICDWHRATATARPSYLSKADYSLQTTSLHGIKDHVKRNFPYSVLALYMELSDTSRDGSTTHLVKKADVEITCGEDMDASYDFTDLDVIEFEGVLNFRAALPGTGLPIYRCAALDNATFSDAVRLLTPGIINSSASSDNKWYNLRAFTVVDLVNRFCFTPIVATPHILIILHFNIAAMFS